MSLLMQHRIREGIIHVHYIGPSFRALSDLSLAFERRYHFTAFAMDEPHRLQELTVGPIVNRPKPNNDGFQTFLAIALDMPFHPTFSN